MTNEYALPTSLLRSLDRVSPGAPRVLFVRHADRDRARLGTWGDEIPLNANGIERSKVLARALGTSTWATTSPMQRCRQTGSLVTGTPVDKVATSSVLGVPGPFILDVPRSMVHFEGLGTHAVVQRMIEGASLDGIRQLQEGTTLLLGFIATTLTERTGTGVCISHDSIVAPVVGSLFGEPFTSRWIDFLEGIVFTRSVVGMQAFWDGEVRVIGRC